MALIFVQEACGDCTELAGGYLLKRPRWMTCATRTRYVCSSLFWGGSFLEPERLLIVCLKQAFHFSFVRKDGRRTGYENDERPTCCTRSAAHCDRIARSYT